jgi:hypothetical protein
VTNHSKFSSPRTMWLRSNHEPSDIVMGRHKLIVFEYDYRRLCTSLPVSSRRLKAPRGKNWRTELGALASGSSRTTTPRPHSETGTASVGLLSAQDMRGQP